MRKDFGAKAVVTPLPVLIIATYDEKGTPNAMNVAWGGQCGPKHIALNLGKHKTNENLKATNAFTVSFATVNDVVASDYFGIASGNVVPDKVAKAQMHTHKSAHVNAPIIDEYPLTLECKVVEMVETSLGEIRVVGEVVNMSADESVLDAAGNVDLGKVRPISFDSASNAYRVLGEKVGNAFSDGKKLK